VQFCVLSLSLSMYPATFLLALVIRRCCAWAQHVPDAKPSKERRKRRRRVTGKSGTKGAAAFGTQHFFMARVLASASVAAVTLLMISSPLESSMQLST